ncbi:kinase-like domain-containing protein [Thamnocephalis sphaerospora]|uniref:Kinase-like domain-containing protein n=1 Tax=Thamnocephalis sphaerospora TaxID=78915 RepID=A0A4P9XVG4_9FUNG|nr:kinase-like domain-containing protein [Thamnocephalis sphaerospora]|eukprot:RKP10248.1 kinase-like domain-containing protein [Thamnocephalis sphaerospora]
MRLLSASVLLSMAAVVLMSSHLTPAALAQIAGPTPSSWPSRSGLEIEEWYPDREDGLRTAAVKYNNGRGLLKCTKHLMRRNDEVKMLETLGRKFEPLGDVLVPRVLGVFSTKEGDHCMVLESVYGPTLREFIPFLKDEDNGPFLEYLATQTILGVKFMHQEGIVYGNINPDNIIVKPGSEWGSVKLVFTGIEPANTQRGHGMYGYIPPEEYAALGVHPYKRDAWMLGATLYFVANGMPPYGYTYSKKQHMLIPVPVEDLERTMKEEAVTGQSSFSPIKAKNQALVDVVKQLLSCKVEDRLEVSQIDDDQILKIAMGVMPLAKTPFKSAMNKLRAVMIIKKTIS